MSLDRRIVSILYYNGIDDVKKVEKFIGEKEGYYEIMLDGKLMKLKIPGVEYFEIPTVEDLESKIKKLDGNIEKLNKTFPEVLETVVESARKEQLFVVTEIKITNDSGSFGVIGDTIRPNINLSPGISGTSGVYSDTPIHMKKEEISFEEEMKKDEEEKKEVLKSIKKETKPRKPRSPKLSDKKIEIIETKNIDDEFNDFIDSI